jgi:hypothetical protein
MNTPVARELAETHLLLQDVRQSFEAIKLWFKKYAERKLDSIEEELIHDSL